MGLNITALNNINNITINESLLSGDIISNAANNVETQLGDVFSTVIFTLIFMYLLYEFNRQDGIFGFDVSRSLALSSGIALILSLVFVLTPYSNNFKIVVFFAIIFVFSVFAVRNAKVQGQ